MPTEPQDERDSVNAALADYLHANRDSILSDWRTRVLADKDINTARSVNTLALTNRLPYLFDDLGNTLRSNPGSPLSSEHPHHPPRHGATAWQQGYILSEVMRELKHFRSLLIYHLRLFEELHPDHGMAALLFVSTVTHRFLDDIVISITDEFLAAQIEENDAAWRRRLQKPGENPQLGS